MMVLLTLEFGLRPANTPSGMPTKMAMIIAVKASSMVAGMRCRMSFKAGSAKMKDFPRSALQSVDHEVPILLVNRAIQTQRADGRLDVFLIRFPG